MSKKWVALVLLTLGANFACAASFDCDKAGTKVEKMICADSELSKLDEELGAVYSKSLNASSDPAALKQRQRNWLKVRNSCQENDCLKSLYQKRLHVLSVVAKKRKVDALRSADEIYDIVMSKNDDVCNYMRQIMMEDLHQFGRGYDSNDRFVSTHDVFNAVPWRPVRVSNEWNGELRSWDDDGALLDLNNDGVVDFVVRHKSMLSGFRLDLLYMLDRSFANEKSGLTSKDLSASENVIKMDQMSYPLIEPLDKWTMSFWFIDPFVYQGTTYLYLQPLRRPDTGDDMDFVMIAKYFGGKFFMREMTGKMEDVCYIKRVDINN